MTKDYYERICGLFPAWWLIPHHNESFNSEVSGTFSIVKQLLKESQENKGQQKPRCLWMTLNEQNTLMAKLGLIIGTTVVQTTALQL